MKFTISILLVMFFFFSAELIILNFISPPLFIAICLVLCSRTIFHCEMNSTRLLFPLEKFCLSFIVHVGFSFRVFPFTRRPRQSLPFLYITTFPAKKKRFFQSINPVLILFQFHLNWTLPKIGAVGQECIEIVFS